MSRTINIIFKKFDRLIVPNVATYFKATVILKVWYLGRDIEKQSREPRNKPMKILLSSADENENWYNHLGKWFGLT